MYEIYFREIDLIWFEIDWNRKEIYFREECNFMKSEIFHFYPLGG